MRSDAFSLNVPPHHFELWLCCYVIVMMSLENMISSLHASLSCSSSLPLTPLVLPLSSPPHPFALLVLPSSCPLLPSPPLVFPSILRTFTRNIRERRGSKIAINIPSKHNHHCNALHITMSIIGGGHCLAGGIRFVKVHHRTAYSSMVGVVC